jgi:hypothetical protein
LLFFAFWASWGVWRFSVGRSGSSDGALPLAVVDPESVVVVSLEGRRVMVGRSGSSAGVVPAVVDDPVLLVVLVVLVGVVEESELSWCFMVGRSGSSAGALPAVVVPLLVVLSVSEARRFMVGRSGSSVVAVLVAVVSGFAAGLLGSVLVGVVESALDLVVRWGRLGSLAELTSTGSVLDGLRAVVVFLGAVSGLTDP